MSDLFKISNSPEYIEPTKEEYLEELYNMKQDIKEEMMSISFYRIMKILDVNANKNKTEKKTVNQFHEILNNCTHQIKRILRSAIQTERDKKVHEEHLEVLKKRAFKMRKSLSENTDFLVQTKVEMAKDLNEKNEQIYKINREIVETKKTINGLFCLNFLRRAGIELMLIKYNEIYKKIKNCCDNDSLEEVFKDFVSPQTKLHHLI